MTQTRKVEECKKILFKLAIKHGVAPKLISERLLSLQDKEDMLQGLVSFETLNCAVEMWLDNEMRNYADGSRKPYENFRMYQAKRKGE